MLNVFFVFLLLVLSTIIYEKSRKIKNLKEPIEGKNISWFLVVFFIFFIMYVLYKFSLIVAVLIMIYMFFSLSWVIYLLYKNDIDKESIIKNWKMMNSWFWAVNIIGITYMALNLFLLINF